MEITFSIQHTQGDENYLYIINMLDMNQHTTPGSINTFDK